jgi:DNA transposition AAA+ family ATPase
VREDIFINTQNFMRFEALCNALLKTALGLEMATVVGSTGRGKSTSAERIISMNPNTVLVRFQERFTHVGLIREIGFMLGGARPRSTDRCFEIIQNELAHRRRVILVDEADRMSLKHLNTLRDLHDVLKAPIVLIGEESILALLERERRLKSRVAHEIRFEPIGQVDIAAFYEAALSQDISTKHAVALSRHSSGDFRTVVNDAIQIERIMKASGLKAISDELIKEICHENGGPSA